MENENVSTELELDAASEAEEITADVDETDYETEEDTDVELEEDEDGGITYTTAEAVEEAEEEPAEANPEEAEKTPDDAARLRAEIATREEKLRAMLKALGYDEEDLDEGIDSVAAEAEGKTLEEYRAKVAETAAQKAAEKADFDSRFAAKVAADLAAVHAAIPATKKYASVDDFPNAQRFKELCDKGCTPEEAFRASHGSEVAEAAATAQVRDSKAHLRSNVPKGAREGAHTITRAELEAYREMFPGMSDKDIAILHRKATKK
jgi:hypothetical protein